MLKYPLVHVLRIYVSADLECGVLEDAGERNSRSAAQWLLALYTRYGVVGAKHRRPHPVLDHRRRGSGKVKVTISNLTNDSPVADYETHHLIVQSSKATDYTIFIFEIVYVYIVWQPTCMGSPLRFYMVACYRSKAVKDVTN